MVKAAALRDLIKGMFSGKQPAGQRVEHGHPDAVRFQAGHEFRLDAAAEQVVDVLAQHRARRTAHHGTVIGVGQLPGGIIADAPVADLSGTRDVRQRIDRFLERRVRVRHVQVIHVDPVRAQAPQAPFDLAEDRTAVQAFTV